MSPGNLLDIIPADLLDTLWLKINAGSLHCVSKSVPTFKLSVTLSNFNRFSKFLHCWKAYEICYKTTQHYQPHLKNVATPPWEIKKSNFLQIFSRYGQMQTNCIFIASNFVVHPQILIFSVFNIASFFPVLIADKIFCITVFFYLFTLQSVCGTGNSSQQTSLQCLSTISMVFSNEDKILIKTQIHSHA